MTPSVQTEQFLVLENAGFFTVGAVLVLFAACMWLYLQGIGRTRSGARRWTLLSLRATSLLLIASFLLGASLEQRRYIDLPAAVAVVVDTSQSMDFRASGSSRLERVRAWLEDALAAGGRAANYVGYVFDRKLAGSSLERLERAGSGDGTDIAAAIEQLARQRESSSIPIAGVVLVSDGADTARLSGWTEGMSPPRWLERLVEQLDVPLNTVAVGGDESFLDVAVADIRYDPFAFIRNAVEIEVELEQVGAAGKSVLVSLEREGRLLDSKQVVLGQGRTPVKLKFVPDEVGKFIHEVVVSALPSESVLDNNRGYFATRVVRDKTRVLHVVGRPSWDVRFLRELLKKNPGIDLVSFYILRTLADAPGVDESELSLIPFPVSQLFGSELDTFDLVIFQNFNPGPYAVGFYLQQLADYVERGGAICLVGGDLSFGSGGYAGTPLERILPVTLLESDDWRVEPFRPVPAGTSVHPIVEFASERDWQRLPELGSFNMAKGLQQEAQALLVHPFARTDGGERVPVIAVRQVGRGRSAAVLTDGTWRWRFGVAASGRRPDVYVRLWSNLIRWLVRDPAMEPVMLVPESPVQDAGKPVALEVRYLGTGPAEMILEARKPGDANAAVKTRLVLQPGERRKMKLSLDGHGTYELRLKDAATGRAVKKEIVVLRPLSDEMRHLLPRPGLLRMLARVGGGKFQELGTARLSGDAIAIEPQKKELSRTTRPLLSLWMVVLIALLLWSIEWWLRRWWGYP